MIREIWDWLRGRNTHPVCYHPGRKVVTVDDPEWWGTADDELAEMTVCTVCGAILDEPRTVKKPGA